MREQSAIVLLSGGLDSSVAWALERGDKEALFIDYGQRNASQEWKCAQLQTKGSKLRFTLVDWPLMAGLLKEVPLDRGWSAQDGKVAPTYLPGRNTVFLSLAWGLAQQLGATKIVIGANRHDYDGYPDCRPKFFEAFQAMTQTIYPVDIGLPLINKAKDDIICIGKELGVDLDATWSCYLGGNKPCGRCDACFLRANGFEQARLREQPERKGL